MKRTFAVLLVVIALAVACHTDIESVEFVGSSSIATRLHSLGIGEAYSTSDNETFLRVPGGWVYHRWSGYGVAATFIPYSSEGTGEGVPARAR